MYMIYGAPMDVAFWLSQSSLFRRCSFIYGLKEDRCCLIQQILLLTSCFPNRCIQLEFCHSKIRAVIIPKKNLPGLIQKWGRVIIGVKSPHLIQSKLKNYIWISAHVFSKEKNITRRMYEFCGQYARSNWLTWISRAMPRLSRMRSLNRW